jgi:glycerophosphoryl diester phosphodiesterase
VRRSADGTLVVHHDPHVDLDGEAVPITTLARADLPGHLPTLREAIEACTGMWVNVEIKNDPGEAGFEADDRLADDTLAELAAFASPQRWVISSFRIETIDRCRAVDPAVRTAWLTSLHPPDVVERLVAGGHHAWHPLVKVLGRDQLLAAHAAGIVVNTWTCDDPARMAELLAWGIDGICTNLPDVALRVRGSTTG